MALSHRQWLRLGPSALRAQSLLRQDARVYHFRPFTPTKSRTSRFGFRDTDPPQRVPFTAIRPASSLSHPVASDHLKDPLSSYVHRVESGVLSPDPLQVHVLDKLQRLHETLRDYEPPSLEFFDDRDRLVAERKSRLAKKRTDYLKKHGSDAVVPDFAAADPPIEAFEPPRGLYLHGPVGCGKTLLMDLFFDSNSTARKKRVHFHAFVLEVHSALNRWRVTNSELDERPLESIARNLMKEHWLLCFDEIQHTDYGSSLMLQQIFSFMISRGAVIVSTSNRAPSELGASGFTEEQKTAQSEALGQLAQLLVNANDVLEMPSDKDYRLMQPRGKPSYFYPHDPATKNQMDEAFHDLTSMHEVGPGRVTVYGREVHLPITCEAAKVARCSFDHLFKNPPLGPADYVAICNEYSTVFIDDVPILSINDKNEARRFLSFIDSAYESKTNVFFLAATRPEDIFQLIPVDADVDSQDKMQMEMLGEMAFDLKADLKQRTVPVDLRSLGILSGEDEIFSFKRAISRINEMRCLHYQREPHRAIAFAPFVASAGERALADARRHRRERRRREELDSVYPTPTKVPMMNLSAEWGSEASFEVWSVENMDSYNKKRRSEEAAKRRESAPRFPEQHFYGAGWWETVVNRVKGTRASKSTDDK